MTRVTSTLVGCLLGLSLAWLAPSSEVRAADLGVRGTIYPILEADLLAAIRAKLGQLAAEGKIDQLNRQMQERTIAYVNRPPRLEGITRAQQDRSWLFDPSMVLQEDLRDQDGRVFYRAGTRVNPLEFRPLTQHLLFIDGDDEEQVEWALDVAKNSVLHTKIILIAGNIMDLMKAKKVQFFFDQQATLTSRFNIQRVPARVSQEGLALRIEEFAL